MKPKSFSIYIESQVREKNITHMDAILEYCIKNEIEPDSITSLIQKPLKDKIVIEEKIPSEIHAAGTCTYIILTE